MKRLFIAMSLCLCCFTCFAQDGLKLADSSTPIFSSLKNYRLALLFHGRKDALLNKSFQTAQSTGVLTPSWTLGLSAEAAVFGPLYVEAGAFKGGYTVADTFDDVPAGEISSVGVEAFVNWHVLPYLGRISHFLIPYFGVGYQYGKMSSGEWSQNLSAPLVKGGLMIKYGSICFGASYRQVIPLSQENLQRMISIDLGFNL